MRARDDNRGRPPDLRPAPPDARTHVLDYVDLQVQTVESVQHPIGFNATAIDFGALHIARIDLAVTLDDLPCGVPEVGLGV